jgi:GAF domain-containing protein
VTSVIEQHDRTALLTRAGLESKTIHESLNQICASVVMMSGADQSEINVINGDTLHHVAYYPTPFTEGKTEYFADESACQIVVATGMPLVLDDVRDHPMCASQWWVGTIESYIGVPLMFEGETFGALCAFTLTPTRWTNGQLIVMQGLARLVEASLPRR